MKYFKNYESYKDNIDIKKFMLKHNIRTIKDELEGLNIKKIIRHYANSVGLHGRIKTIGWGNFGIAFEINNKVIKLTKDISEAWIAQRLIGYDFKHLPNYYDVKKIKFKERNLNLAFILLEKLTPLSKKDEYLIGEFDYLYNIHDFFNPDKELNNEKLENSLSNYNEEEKKRMLYLIEKMRDMTQEFKKYKIDVSDFHEQNIGWKNGNLAFFDMGVQQANISDIKKTHHYNVS